MYLALFLIFSIVLLISHIKSYYPCAGRRGKDRCWHCCFAVSHLPTEGQFSLDREESSFVSYKIALLMALELLGKYLQVLFEQCYMLLPSFTGISDDINSAMQESLEVG